MANFSIKIDLLKLGKAFVSNVTGKTGTTKRCLIIPIDDARLFVGERGVYLNLTGIETKEQKYGDTHCLKQNIEREVYDALTDEERKALPILGGMHEYQSKQITITETITKDDLENPDDAPF